jgi:hypothetical protein
VEKFCFHGAASEIIPVAFGHLRVGPRERNGPQLRGGVFMMGVPDILAFEEALAGGGS